MGVTAKNLRNSILQYAMEGRLVSQSPEDESISVLLARIDDRREGQKGRNNRTYIKNEAGRFYEYIGSEKTDITDDIPFDIPDTWAWVRLGNIGIWRAGATPSRSNPEYYEGDIPWLKTGDLNDGYISSVPEHINQLALQKTSVKINPVGSVLIAMYGATIGKLGILNIKSTTNQACCACLPYEGVLNKYLFYFLMSQKVAFIKRGEGGAQPNISKEKIVSTLMPLPPFNEQKRIVKAIDDILPLIVEYDKLETEFSILDENIHDRLWNSILQYALEGKLVSQNTEEGTAVTLVNRIYAEKRRLEQDGLIKKSNNESVIYRDSDGRYCEKRNNSVTDVTDEIPFDIPESWSWCRLGDIVAVNPRNSLLDGLESSFVEMSAIKEGYCSRFTYVVKPWGKIKSGYTHFRDGDVGFAKITPCFQNRKSVVFRNLKNGYGAGTTELNILRPYSETILPEYLLWFVKSPYFIQRGISNLSGTAGQQRFGTDSVKLTMIPIPPYEEQKRIVDEIEKYESVLFGLGELV